VSANPIGWVENRARDRRIPKLALREFWASRELAYFFATRDLKVRYKQAILGFAGVLLQPVIGALAFTFMFNGLAGIQTEGSYFMFALSGFVAWSFISGTIDGGANSLLEHDDLISHVRFPLLAAPVASILVAFVDFAIGSVIVGALSVVVGDGISPVGLVVGFPAGVLLMSVFAMGPALIFAPLLVKYRDTGTLLGVGLQVMFFLGPIAYPPELVGETWRHLQYLNPATGALSLYRWGMIDAPAPAITDLVLSIAVSVTTALFGLITFRRNEQTLVDVI